MVVGELDVVEECMVTEARGSLCQGALDPIRTMLQIQSGTTITFSVPVIAIAN